MRLVIWKTALRPVDVQDIEVPDGAEFLAAREQGESICVWYRCNPDAPKMKARVAIVGTGNPAPEDGSYIGTGMLHGGALVLHVFVKAA